jgi:hypothetical protein
MHPLRPVREPTHDDLPELRAAFPPEDGARQGRSSAGFLGTDSAPARSHLQPHAIGKAIHRLAGWPHSVPAQQSARLTALERSPYASSSEQQAQRRTSCKKGIRRSQRCLGSGRRGSNPRPSAWEADALPTELRPRAAILAAVFLGSSASAGSASRPRTGPDRTCRRRSSRSGADSRSTCSAGSTRGTTAQGRRRPAARLRARAR